jgi:hypothetical protein
MKLLFLTPPMENWVRWGSKHVAGNPLHAQLAAYVRQQDATDVAVLDCRALELDAAAMLDRVKRIAPDAIFLGTRLVTDGGAVPLVRHRDHGIARASPQAVTILGGLGASAIAKRFSCRRRSAIFYAARQNHPGGVSLFQHKAPEVAKSRARLRQAQNLFDRTAPYH